MSWQISISTCDFTWWEHLIWTLIPFLLGLLLGYLLWYRYRHQILRLEEEVDVLQARNSSIQNELDDSSQTITELEARIARLESDLSGSRLAYGTLQASANKVVTAPAPTRKDPLTKIEGIGPKTEELLYSKDVQSFQNLAHQKVSTLKKMLDEAGRNNRLLDPGTWPKQAKMAANGQWDKLRKYQDRLIGGREPELARPEPDVSGTSTIFGKKVKLNDLKLIEGIGPKIEQLLQQGGISTWWELSDSKAKSIQKILDEAGPRYRLANPGTWPKQARMAARGQWKKLKKYQDELDGGRD